MIFWILAALSFIQAAEVTENKILVEQHPLLITYNENATLACKYAYNGTGNEFRASLNKGADRAVEVCSVSWNGSFHNHNSNKDFNCIVAADSNIKQVNFNLWNLKANQTDIYFCKIEVMFPPPYIYNDKSNGTVIHVKGKTQNHNCSIFFPQPTRLLWALVVTLGILAFYSILITATFVVCWWKNKRNRILTSDYMNMTPRHPPGTKNKHYQPYAPTRIHTEYRSWEP
ncbi:T-cell-specific surface glycoprotein CD28 [Emydura macquarii macquarii]|uniref:T-cell-specific surface glycoprotein CD28 n=1 Tax=Emydura macquarii macquarii TaxID=1129001 RepID=UPI00352ACD72